LESPDITINNIATLSGGVKKLSPMLAARYKFCGKWKNATASQTWLGLKDVNKSFTNSKINKAFKLRLKYWEKSIISKFDIGNISLFGIDYDECDETYLLWGRGMEPKLVTYIGHNECFYKDLRSYIYYLLGNHSAQQGDRPEPVSGHNQ
jgi:hypothetical protein